MMPRVAIITGLLLVVAVLAFAGLAYQSVPMSRTSTVTGSFTRNWSELEYYTMTVTDTSTPTIVWTATHSYYVGYTGFSCPIPPASCVSIATWSVALQPSLTTYEPQSTLTVPEAETVTSSVTESSTSVVPASAALGLTDGSFSGLALLVFGTLSVLSAWVIFNPIMDMGQDKATPTQFTKVPTVCIKCGAEIPPASAFCDRCGAKQEDVQNAQGFEGDIATCWSQVNNVSGISVVRVGGQSYTSLNPTRNPKCLPGHRAPIARRSVCM